MTPRARPAPKRAKTAAKRRKDASPLNGVVPPPEHRFGVGNKAAVGHGRPRKLAELQELIYEILSEDLTDPTGKRLGTRAQAMVRIGLTKNPLPFLEYAFGKVPQQIDVNDVSNRPDSELVDELFRLANDIRTRTGAGTDSGTPAAGAGDGGAPSA